MTRALVVMCSVVSSLALAQGKTLKDKEEIKFNEIERGFTIGMAAGGQMMFAMPGSAIKFDSNGNNTGCARAPFSGGEVVRVDIGADIGSRGDDPRSAVPLLVVTGMMQAGQIKAGSTYLGTSSTMDTAGRCVTTSTLAPTGDFAMLAGGLAAKVNLVGFADSQDVKRLWIYVRAAGGVNAYFPNSLISTIDVMLQAGAGVEYYTRLRHFAIGLEADFQMLFLTTTFGVTITPTLRYSF